MAGSSCWLAGWTRLGLQGEREAIARRNGRRPLGLVQSCFIPWGVCGGRADSKSIRDGGVACDIQGRWPGCDRSDSMAVARPAWVLA